MPRKSKKTVEIDPEVTIIEEIEVIPKKPVVHLWKKTVVPNYNVHQDVSVGEIIYWDSTQDITYSYEANYYAYMKSFVNRSIKVGTQYINRADLKEWFENLPNATFIDGVFASEVLTFDEN